MKTQEERNVDCEENVFDGVLYFREEPVFEKKVERISLEELIMYNVIEKVGQFCYIPSGSNRCFVKFLDYPLNLNYVIDSLDFSTQ